MIQGLNQVTVDYLRLLPHRAARKDSEAFCAAGLGYATSDTRREQRQCVRSKIVSVHREQVEQFCVEPAALAAVYQELSQESVERALAVAEELRAENDEHYNCEQ